MAIANNSEGASVPPDISHNLLEMEDEYSKLTPSADYTSPPGRNIFRNKKFTKKRHEPKTRKTAEGQDPSTVNCSEDEEDPKSPPATTELYHRSIPKMMMSINQTIKKMSIKDNGGGGGTTTNTGDSGVVTTSTSTPICGPSCSSKGGETGRVRKGTGVQDTSDSTAVEPRSSCRSTYNCGQSCMFPNGGAQLLAALEKVDQEEMEKGAPITDDDDEDAEARMCSQAETVRVGIEMEDTVDLESVSQCQGGDGRTCHLQSHPQGKRRRHRRKQQYKRMAVDVQSDKCLKLKKVPHSNSSEDSGIGKRKRNIIPSDSVASTSAILKAATSGAGIVPVPVRASSSFGSGESYQTMSGGGQYEQHWKLDQDSDAVMMDYDDMESSSNTRIGKSRSHITEEESGESDTQNDDIESLSDHNQDADDEESDYYNNDSSTTSLSESSFTILNPSKKFIPVHSREIRAGRRRLKNTTFPSVENEEVSKFLQSPSESILKVCASSEKERQDFINVASLYSLSYEECQDQEDQRMWVQFTKTSKTTTTTQQQRRNAEAIKAGDRSSFNTFSEGSLAPLFDILVQETREAGEISDVCIDDWDGNGTGANVGVGVNQLVNSKRIKKGC